MGKLTAQKTRKFINILSAENVGDKPVPVARDEIPENAFRRPGLCKKKKRDKLFKDESLERSRPIICRPLFSMNACQVVKGDKRSYFSKQLPSQVNDPFRVFGSKAFLSSLKSEKARKTFHFFIDSDFAPSGAITLLTLVMDCPLLY